MIKITKEEINLCKQIVKKYRGDIEYGDFYIEPKTQKGILLWDYEDSPYFAGDQCSDTVPLWTISDCLEFLDKHTIDWSLDKDVDEEGKQTGKFCFWWMPSPKYKDNYRIGKTKLETCLKPVLAVLKEGK